MIWDLKPSDGFFVSQSILPKTRKRVYDFDKNRVQRYTRADFAELNRVFVMSRKLHCPKSESEKPTKILLPGMSEFEKPQNSANDLANCYRKVVHTYLNRFVALHISAYGTPRRIAAVRRFGRDRSEADMPRASGAG